MDWHWRWILLCCFVFGLLVLHGPTNIVAYIRSTAQRLVMFCGALQAQRHDFLADSRPDLGSIDFPTSTSSRTSRLKSDRGWVQGWIRSIRSMVRRTHRFVSVTQQQHGLLQRRRRRGQLQPRAGLDPQAASPSDHLHGHGRGGFETLHGEYLKRRGGLPGQVKDRG